MYVMQVEVMTKYGGRTKLPWNLFGDNMLFVRLPLSHSPSVYR